MEENGVRNANMEGWIYKFGVGFSNDYFLILDRARIERLLASLWGSQHAASSSLGLGLGLGSPVSLSPGVRMLLFTYFVIVTLSNFTLSRILTHSIHITVWYQ